MSNYCGVCMQLCKTPQGYCTNCNYAKAYQLGRHDAFTAAVRLLEERAEMACPGAPRWTFLNAARGVAVLGDVGTSA